MDQYICKARSIVKVLRSAEQAVSLPAVAAAISSATYSWRRERAWVIRRKRLP